VETARVSGPVLDAQAYVDLVKPSKAVAPFTYRSVATGLFSRIVMSEMSMDDPIRRVCLASPRVVQ
jgi:cytochrome o ubiquinol oxidase subunit 2